MKNILVLFAMCSVLTGCFSNQTEKQPVHVNEVEDTLPSDEKNVSLDKVIEALKKEGIELSIVEEQYFILNSIKSSNFSVNESDEDEEGAYPKTVSIYVYDSEHARKEGLDDFNIQKERYNMQIPNIYEQKNVILLYWHHENLNNSHNAKYSKSKLKQR